MRCLATAGAPEAAAKQLGTGFAGRPAAQPAVDVALGELSRHAFEQPFEEAERVSAQAR
ncbi:hypothetical protein OHA25_15230 [Nonomuraea sp. NBC_00507]|uniref:hypothetical protein n=1 Tax=Nonomuraea sp. NBC_00507 TaxID=2976002 RepID=UPI002E19A756